MEEGRSIGVLYEEHRKYVVESMEEYTLTPGCAGATKEDPLKPT